jgi:hypothetical protein
MTVATARLPRDEIDHELIWGWVALGSAVLGAFLIARIGLPPIVCPFRALTGLPCLTCGATRAFAALIRGDVTASVRLNPLVPIGAACAIVYVPYALVVAHANLPRVRVHLTSADWVLIRIVVSVVVVSVWTYLIVDGR